MNKDSFDSIEVPTEELDSARNKAIMKGIQEQQKKKKRTIGKIYKVLLPVAAAVTITLGLGFVSEPIAQAVSSIPIVGETIAGFYESYANKTGNENALTEQERIDETSIISTDQGITVEIVGTYVEGAQTIGIFFEASGEIDPEKVYGYDVYAEDGSVIQSGVGPDSGYSCYIFDHTSDQERIDFETAYDVKCFDLELVDGVYVGNIEIEFEDKNYLETIDSIPLTFNYMCGKEGEWSFEIPVEVEDDPNTIDINQTQSEHGFTIAYESIYLGRDTATLYYSVAADTSFEGNEEVIPTKQHKIHVTFEDSNGEEIGVSSIDIPDGWTGTSSESGLGTWHWSGKVTFSEPLPEGCESITVKIEVETETGDIIVLTPYVLDLK